MPDDRKAKMSDDNLVISPELRNTLDNLSEVVAGIIKNMAPIQELAGSLAEAMKPIVEQQKQIVETWREVFQKIELNLPKIELPESFIKLLKDVKYLSFLEKTNWPLFLDNNQKLQESLFSKYGEMEDNFPLEEISELVCSYYQPEDINKIFGSWSEVFPPDSERMKILNESIFLHNTHKYYGSTALLMSQINALISETNKMLEENDISTDEEDIKVICDYYKVAYDDYQKNIGKSERTQILRLMAMTENGFFYWNAVSKYIRDIVLATKNDDLLMEHNPMRNKIFHGIQLNYGTEEHSLKAILSLDLLIQLYKEIETIIKKQYKRLGLKSFISF